jgi:hypothetical protein
MSEGISRCTCGAWVHRARECKTCEMLKTKDIAVWSKDAL